MLKKLKQHLFNTPLPPNNQLSKLKLLENGLNAYTFAFKTAILDEIRQAYKEQIEPFLLQSENSDLFKGGKRLKLELGHFLINSFEQYPLLWISNHNFETYTMFNRCFKAMNIEYDLKQLIDYNQDIVLYCGFFVVGNYAKQAEWHMDYYPGANAYTLITPLFELKSDHGHLWYKNKYKRTKTYTYSQGEAIILGDYFYHSTQPYQPQEQLRVLLSLTFGTDKLEHWPITKCTISKQSDYLILPCGHVKGDCECLLYK